MNAELKRRIFLWVSIGVTAVVAALFAVWYFDLATPARDINLILNSASLPEPPTPVRPTPTVIPPTPALILSDSLTRTVNFPRTAFADYTRQGYALKPVTKTDYVAAPLLNFQDTQYRDVTLLATGAPVPPTTTIEYGVFFWHSNYRNKGERFLAFTISTEGTYRLRAFIPFTTGSGEGVGYRAEDLVPATRSLYIKTDGTPNKLRVDVHPHQILAFVNGGLVLNRNDSDIDAYRNLPEFDGKVGLVAFGAGSTDSQVTFTQFMLYADLKP